MSTPTTTAAIHWFEIPVHDLDRAQRAYEAVFEYAPERGCGAGLQPGGSGTLVYLNAEPSLDAAVQLAQPRLDPQLAQQAEDALGRILAVLPPAERRAAERLALFAPDLQGLPGRERLGPVREAIDARQKLRLDYRDATGQPSLRTVRPLACFCWNHVWTLGAWCEQRQDFRSFRLDRIATLDVLEERFSDESGRTLADFLRTARER